MSLVRASRTEMVAGVDEAGRGPLAGPLVAAAVILPKGDRIDGLDDSKKLSERRRSFLDGEIRSRSVCWSLGMATVAEIDTLNIHHATLLAMRRAVLSLRATPDLVLVDGKFTPELPVAVRAEIDGDARFEAIAAASILAKQARDAIMLRLHEDYPGYGFDAHKGYPTRAHRDAIARYGVSECHRRSFATCRGVPQARSVTL